ncbi:MAG TPA: FHA domain-containing protein [Gaiellaceae bacterium]|nr:FHA domain-containing protein [Gaiellaceae bacterium]
MSHIYCSECGYQNSEAANFCARCGALLEREAPDAEQTLSYTPEHLAEDAAAGVEGVEGPALAVRSGGGRSGEVFVLQGERTTIGRSPDCDIFLDDVTVSRRHAVITEENGSFVIEDQGSLNGTFLNRHRIEQAPLTEDDELQVGKYRLVFLAR